MMLLDRGSDLVLLGLRQTEVGFELQLGEGDRGGGRAFVVGLGRRTTDWGALRLGSRGSDLGVPGRRAHGGPPGCQDDNDQDDNDDDHNDGCEAPAQGPILCREPYCVASTKLR